MGKAIELIKGYCQIKGYDEKDMVDMLKSAFIGWYSRSVASAVFVFCKNKNGKWYVLASERGEEAADFQGYWNCPCGYLDFDETAAGAARRECYEETGVILDINKIKCVSYEDDPITANRQNVTFRFVCIIDDKTIDEFVFSKKNNEGKEVGKISWIPIESINSYSWAFNHKERINEIFEQHVDPEGKYRFWRKVKNFFNGIGDFLSDF
jgi:8-oxo-dGTP pyrophosphatase MutT (NUDIX family)